MVIETDITVMFCLPFTFVESLKHAAFTAYAACGNPRDSHKDFHYLSIVLETLCTCIATFNRSEGLM